MNSPHSGLRKRNITPTSLRSVGKKRNGVSIVLYIPKQSFLEFCYVQKQGYRKYLAANPNQSAIRGLI